MWKVVFPVFAALLAFGLSQPNLMGGTQKITDAENDDGFQKALQFAVSKYNDGTNDTFLYQVVKVVSAEHQLVDGSKYTMTVILGKTNCEKGQPTENCAVNNDPGKTQCTFDVWSRPWLNSIQLTKQECGDVQPDSE